MKKFLKNILYFLLSLFEHKGVVVLMYHSVGDNKEFFTVLEKEFEQQMRYLSENKFNVISVAELVKMLENNLPTPKKTVVITFDDGYEDNALKAFPFLRKYNFPATIFVSSGNIGKTGIGKNGTTLKAISGDDIKEMDNSGLISIESHSNFHVKLPSLSEAEIREQLVTSKNVLKGILGKDVDFIAYPSGKVNREVEKITKEYFRAGFGVQKGRIMRGDDLMVLKRNSIDSEVSFTQFRGIAAFGRI